MWKKTVVIILCICLSASGTPLVALAEETETIDSNMDFSKNAGFESTGEVVEAVNPWNNTSDISWYDESVDEYNISTAEQLAGLSELVNKGNTFEGKTISLMNDIFLNDESYQYEWIPIAVGDKVFNGTFNGNNHVVYNMFVSEDGGGGLFGCIGEKGIVKAVNISQGLLYSGGCIADVNEGMIAFCNNYSCVEGWNVGGICNYNYNLVYGCKNYGEVWGSSSAAGIVSYNMETLSVVSQCSNRGSVAGGGSVVGIVYNNCGWIYNCYNTGVISGDSDMAGIVRTNVECAVESCYSAGSFTYDYVRFCAPIVLDDFVKRELNCYALPSDEYTNTGLTNIISREEMTDPDFVEKLNQQTHTLLPAWMEDVDGINGGLPITVADYNYANGNYKIQPELWMYVPESQTIKLDLGGGDYRFGFDCYYNEAEPVVTIEDADIAEVIYKDGVRYIRPLKKGTTQVRIHFLETENNISADYEIRLEVTEQERPLQSISLNETSISLQTGENQTLKVTYVPADTTDNKTVIWTSSNNNVASVDENGKVNAQKAGTATITATVGEKSASCTVTVRDSGNDENTDGNGTGAGGESSGGSTGGSSNSGSGNAGEGSSSGGNTGGSNNSSTGGNSGESTGSSGNTENSGNNEDTGSNGTTNDVLQNGWYEEDGAKYWYENGIRQGTEGRGKEIYDPATDAWYWLDAVDNGKVATNKDVYQESSGGKWVRYDENGRMIKGEDYRYEGWYYFEPVTGTMMKGPVMLPDGRKVFYDTVTGQMLKGEHNINGQTYVFDEGDGHLISGDDDCIWIEIDGKKYWYENWQRQGWAPANEAYRGKEIFDEASNAWYWLDNIQQGAMAVSKDVYQESYAGDWGDYVGEDGQRYGKWVRYDENGHMIKGWQTNENGTYYFDLITGTMAKGQVNIDGDDYYFDGVTGIQAGEKSVVKVVSLVNEERKKEGLPPLAIDTQLLFAAQERTTELFTNYSHTRPDGTSCFTILDAYGISYSKVAENIAAGYMTPEEMVEGWMDSPGHRANILGDYTHIGVGHGYKEGDMFGHYWTQLFIKK